MKNHLVIFQLIKPVTRFIEKKMTNFLLYLNKNYTPVAVIVLIICSTIFFFVTNYIFRYSHWNYWLWKSRAMTSSIYFALVLIAIKFLIGSM